MECIQRFAHRLLLSTFSGNCFKAVTTGSSQTRNSIFKTDNNPRPVLSLVLMIRRRQGQAAAAGGSRQLAVEAWGLKNCTQKDEWFSDTVTAVVVPPYIDSSEIVRRAWKRYNLSLGLGLNKVAGKVFRIGHLGNLNELQLLGCLAGVEMILKDVGYPVQLGSGVAAASAYLQNIMPMIPSRI